ncbi:hypothetical protein [Streptomyces griseoflavus]|uniref:hypothetical protein n=1 Tax=Streptomyces griseoflavus TaxID=35619 RepID=UPI003D726B50
MPGTAGAARTGAGRTSTVGPLLAVLPAAALAGFLLGSVIGDDEVDARRGLLFAAVFLLLSLGAAAGALWWTRRRAAEFGLGVSRYLRVGRGIQRGELPEDPAELPAAIDIVARRRRALNNQQRRWVRWMTGAAVLLWLVSAVIQLLTAHYGYACWHLLAACAFLASLLGARRQRRRLEAVEQALRDQQAPQDAPRG